MKLFKKPQKNPDAQPYLISISKQNYEKLNQLVKYNKLSSRDELISQLLEMIP